MQRYALVFTTFFFAVFIAFFPPYSQADTMDDAIKELLHTMKTMESMETSLSKMKDTIKMNAPFFLKEVKVIMAREMDEAHVKLAIEDYRKNEFGPDRLYELFRYKFNLERVETEIMLPAYRKHYNEQEIHKLTEFYNSELGQKTLRVNPLITRELSSQTRDMSQMALNQAKEELAYELQKRIEN